MGNTHVRPVQIDWYCITVMARPIPKKLRVKATITMQTTRAKTSLRPCSRLAVASCKSPCKVDCTGCCGRTISAMPFYLYSYSCYCQDQVFQCQTVRHACEAHT